MLMGGLEQVMNIVGNYVKVRLLALPATLMLFAYNDSLLGVYCYTRSNFITYSSFASEKRTENKL